MKTLNAQVGEHIYLKPIAAEDTQNIIRWRNQDFVRKQFLYRELFTQKSHECWLDTMVATKKVYQFIIYLLKEDKPIGSVYLRDVDLVNQKAEFGIFIGEEEELGKGYGVEAAKLIIHFAFEALGLNKVMLRVLADNQRAVRSYQKAGFVQEGYFRDDIKLDNQFRDIIFMSVLAKTYRYESLDN